MGDGGGMQQHASDSYPACPPPKTHTHPFSAQFMHTPTVYGFGLLHSKTNKRRLGCGIMTHTQLCMERRLWLRGSSAGFAL